MSPTCNLSLQQLPVFLLFLSRALFLTVNVSSESLFTKNEKKEKKIHPWLASVLASLPFFSFLKSPSFFCFFDLSTRCLSYAHQSTLVTRNRNFVSMVLIEYPHQYREKRREGQWGQRD